jgi:DNA-binding phage protein
MSQRKQKNAWKRKFRNKAWVARFLTKALDKDEPAELQGALFDVVQSRGGIEAVAKKAGLVEWRLRLMLWDEEEAAKLMRMETLARALGLRLVMLPAGKK